MIKTGLYYPTAIIAFFVAFMPLEGFGEEVAHGHKEEAHRHKHHAALFVGGTHRDVEIETERGILEQSVDAFTIGLDYEYRVSQLFGVGGLVEYAGGDLETTSAMAGLFIHPIGGLKLFLAPGVEHEGDENEFLFRVGVHYNFFFGNFAVTPVFAVDFVEGEESLVYGVSFGYGWH